MNTSTLNIFIDTSRANRAIAELRDALRDLGVEVSEANAEQTQPGSASDGELHDRLVRDPSRENGDWMVETYQVVCRRPATNDEIRDLLRAK